MSADKDKPHVHVLPEDDANREIAIGFRLRLTGDHRCFQVLKSAGGWTNVIAAFIKDYIIKLRNNSNIYVILLIDFDQHAERRSDVMASIPGDLRDRVFVIGAWSNPESLSQARPGGFEAIGMKLAEDCSSGSNSTWNHELLTHNAEEIARMTPILKPMLFPN